MERNMETERNIHAFLTGLLVAAIKESTDWPISVSNVMEDNDVDPPRMIVQVVIEDGVESYAAFIDVLASSVREERVSDLMASVKDAQREAEEED